MHGSLSAGVVTQGSGNGNAYMRGVDMAAPNTWNQSNGTFMWDSFCRVNGITYTGTSGCVVCGPNTCFQSGAPSYPYGFASWSDNQLGVYPGRASTSASLPTNPPASGTTYQNTATQMARIYLPVTTAGTITVSVFHTSGGTAIATPYSSFSAAVNTMIIFDVPAGFFFKVTLSTAVLGSGVAVSVGGAN
jgi:hypothetical protein